MHKSILHKIFHNKGQVGLLLWGPTENSGSFRSPSKLLQIKLILDWIHHFNGKLVNSNRQHISLLTTTFTRTIKYISDWITIPMKPIKNCHQSVLTKISTTQSRLRYLKYTQIQQTKKANITYPDPTMYPNPTFRNIKCTTRIHNIVFGIHTFRCKLKI